MAGSIPLGAIFFFIFPNFKVPLSGFHGIYSIYMNNRYNQLHITNRVLNGILNLSMIFLKTFSRHDSFKNQRSISVISGGNT